MSDVNCETFFGSMIPDVGYANAGYTNVRQRETVIIVKNLCILTINYWILTVEVNDLIFL